MKNYLTFLKKELLEYARTYKLFILLTVFAIFGILNPLMAKLLPEILKSLMATDGGISITLAEPTAFDSWTQFFKNATQMGLIVLVIVFSGILTAELSKGTLINLLTKGLPRHAVILAKFTGMVLLWTASLLLCFGLTLVYTVYLFPDGQTTNLLFSVFCLWLFGVLLLALLMFASTLTKSNYGSLLITGAGVVLLMLMDIVPAAHLYNPLALASDNMALLTNAVQPSALCTASLLTAFLSLIMIVSSLLIFRKKQL